jgi:hypothetical protein
MKPLRQRGASVQVGLLAAIAAGIGVYLIATTVLIARDGLFYIDQARKLSGCLSGDLDNHLLGFPLMIAAFRQILEACGMPGGIRTWIVSAQAVALTARLLCLIPMYLIGKRFVGRRRSILGLLILILLPLPAEWGSDALRDFPSLLLLLTTLALLMSGAESGRVFPFALAGLACGIGIGIREELLQLVLYAILWFAWRIVIAGNRADRGKQAASCLVFLAMVSAPVVLHVCASGGNIPVKTASLLRAVQGGAGPDATGNADPTDPADEELNVSDASYRIAQALGGNLHEYFYPFWVVGLICCLRKRGSTAAKFFILAMMVGTLALLYLRYFYYEGGLSKRYLLPLSAGTIFFVPEGIRWVGLWGERVMRAKNEMLSRTMRSKVRISTVLLVLGIAVCLPRLVRPIRWEKEYYRQAARYVAKVTKPDERVWASDRWICLYADRQPADNKTAASCQAIILSDDDLKSKKQLDRMGGWKLDKTFKSTRSSDRKSIYVYKLETTP